MLCDILKSEAISTAISFTMDQNLMQKTRKVFLRATQQLAATQHNLPSLMSGMKLASIIVKQFTRSSSGGEAKFGTTMKTNSCLCYKKFILTKNLYRMIFILPACMLVASIAGFLMRRRRK